MAVISEVRKNHVSTLVSSLEDMMKSEFICDFIIKVGEDSFAVHRVVLAGSSKYFKAMFSSEMKEVKEGYVQMIGVEGIAMKRSIDFMYTGTAEVDTQTLESTLSAATLMQLDGLVELCFHFLEASIAVDSCLRSVRLSSLYGRDDAKMSAEKFLVEHIEDVINEPNFPEIPKEDLIRYIKSSNVSHEISWRAVVTWMKQDFDSKKKSFQGLLRSLKIQQFPFELFHGTVMNDSMLEGADDLKAVLVEEWFSDFTAFKSHLSIENYYNIKSLITEYSVLNQNSFLANLAEFLAEHFEQLSKKEEFLALGEEEILPIFQSTKNQHFPEKVKWNAAVRWVNLNESRVKVFPILFESINLDLLPLKFIQDEILAKALVKESNQCKDALLKYLGSSPIPATHITCLSQSSGEIMTFNPTDNKCDILTVVPDGIGIANVKGDLYLVTRRNFHRLNRDGTWTILPLLPWKVEPSATVLCLRQCVYIIGRKSLQWFNPMTNVWLSRCQRSKDKLSKSRCWSVADGACFTGLDDALYQVGGHVTQNPVKKLNNASALGSEYSRWVPIASMKVKRAFASAEVLRGAIWVIGGGDKSVETYHPVVNVWTMMSEMIFPRERFGACVVGKRLFAVGGAQQPLVPGFTVGGGCENSSFGSPSKGFSSMAAYPVSSAVVGYPSFPFGAAGNRQPAEPVPSSITSHENSRFRATNQGLSSETASQNENFLEGESVEAYEEFWKKWRVVQTVKKLSGNISCCPYFPPPEVQKIDH